MASEPIRVLRLDLDLGLGLGLGLGFRWDEDFLLGFRVLGRGPAKEEKETMVEAMRERESVGAGRSRDKMLGMNGYISERKWGD